MRTLVLGYGDYLMTRCVKHAHALRLWLIFTKACRLLFRRTISLTQLEQARQYLIEYGKMREDELTPIFGRIPIKPTEHMCTPVFS